MFIRNINILNNKCGFIDCNDTEKIFLENNQYFPVSSISDSTTIKWKFIKSKKIVNLLNKFHKKVEGGEMVE